VELFDNMSSHRTLQTRQLSKSLRISYLYSTPASFPKSPIESVFRAIMNTDFRERQLLQEILTKDIPHEKFTKKQYLIAQVNHFLI
jgi:transposase